MTETEPLTAKRVRAEVSALDAEDEESRDANKRARNATSQQNKRRRELESSRHIGVAIACTPERYCFSDTPDGTVSRMIVKYLRNLQQNDYVARPQNWSEIIHLQSRRQELQQPPLQHPWNHLRCTHYCVAATDADLDYRLTSGLPLPVLITAQSAHGNQITAQCSWYNEPIENLLDEILKDGQALIQIQDYSMATISELSVGKRCKDVRDRFCIDPQVRNCAWNYLEVDDRLTGFKRPKVSREWRETSRLAIYQSNRRKIEPITLVRTLKCKEDGLMAPGFGGEFWLFCSCRRGSGNLDVLFGGEENNLAARPHNTRSESVGRI